MYVTPILEFSRDPLSDTTPTWIDVTGFMVEATWGHGKANDLDVPQAGSATFTLDNSDGRFTPEYQAGAYYPDIRPLRRFRWRIQDGITTYDEGIWYVTDWGNDFSTDGGYHEVDVECADGFALLALDRLGALDPPEASSYADVVMFDEPFWYGRLGEKAGATVAPAAGQQGQYRRSQLTGISALLDEAGAVLGDSDTQVLFDAANIENDGPWARVPLDVSDRFGAENRVSFECWVTSKALVNHTILAGPHSTALSSNTFGLFLTATGSIRAEVRFTDEFIASITAAGMHAVGVTRHVVVVWDGTRLRLYVDGELQAEDTWAGKTLHTGDDPGFLYIGGEGITPERYSKAWIDEPAFYEHALTPERVLAHYQAGAERGYPAELAGNRIQDAATSGLWAETKVQAGHHTIIPRVHVGQPRLDEVLTAVKAETPSSLFFFDGVGDPVYLGWEYKATGSYMTPQATFGDGAGEVPYTGIEPVYDDAIFNEVIASREGGTVYTASDGGSQTEFGARTRKEEGLPLVSDDDVRNVAESILASHSQPQQRVASLDLNGIETTGRTQILTRQIGDLIRVKRRPHNPATVAIDIVTHILGISKKLERSSGDLFCTWQLARGFNAAVGQWRAGITGFSEAGTTTKAA